jgi:uncharacterized membrane protein YkvA (DUF1232 family)
VAVARENGEAKRRRRGGFGIGRVVSMLAFLPVASRAPLYARLIAALVVDARVPPVRKALLAGALGYIVLGRDVVPDEIPVLGGLDDLVVVALAVDLFLDGIPDELLHEKLDELGIDRVGFERDIAQVRRLMPGPVRRTIRRAPQFASAVGDAIQRSGLGPRLRAWIDREGSIA